MLGSSVPLVPANDFSRQWQDISDDAIEAVGRVGRSGWLILGEEVRRFEQEFAQWWGIPHAVGVASGLDALEISLRCAGLARGDRVITTPLTAFATTLAIVRAGGVPVWCDVDRTGGLDLDLVDAALRADPSIRAVVPVHLYGHPIDPAAIERVVAEHDVVVVEDCAQSAGAERGDRPTGLAGLAAGTSLYPTKNIGAMGDGGVLLTADDTVAERARRLRNYGQRRQYEHVETGLNSRLDELHAAILRSAMLNRLDLWLARRRDIAARYEDALRDSAVRPIVAEAGRSAHHLFPVEVRGESATTVKEGLARRGIVVGRHYPFICPEQPAAAGMGIVNGPLAVARQLAERELSLPIHPYLRDGEVDLVIEACLEVCS